MGADPDDAERVGILRVWFRYEEAVSVTRTEAGAALEGARAAAAAASVVELEVAGRDLVTGLPRTVAVPSDVLLAASEQPALPW